MDKCSKVFEYFRKLKLSFSFTIKLKLHKITIKLCLRIINDQRIKTKPKVLKAQLFHNGIQKSKSVDYKLSFTI